MRDLGRKVHIMYSTSREDRNREITISRFLRAEATVIVQRKRRISNSKIFGPNLH